MDQFFYAWLEKEQTICLLSWQGNSLKKCPNNTDMQPNNPKYTKTNAHKGIHKGGQARKAPAHLCGGGRRPPPFVCVGFRVFWAVGLHICIVGAFLETIALPAEQTNSLFLFQPGVKEIVYFPTYPEIDYFATRVYLKLGIQLGLTPQLEKKNRFPKKD